jgi:hypothetical protein
MTYFEARRMHQAFLRYRDLALRYWSARSPVPRNENSWMLGQHAPVYRETESSASLRSEIAQLQPEILDYARRLGVAVTATSFPAPAVGGPVIPFNLLGSVTDEVVGHHAIDPQMVLDAIDRCVGAASYARQRLGARLLKPWCWLVDVPALFVGWPFEVMRKAGVPEKFVDGNLVQGIKGAAIALVWLAAFAWVARSAGLHAALQAAVDKFMK